MHRTARSPFVQRVGLAFRRPGLALEGLARRGHAHRSIQSAIESVGIAQPLCAGPRARASCNHPGPWLGLVAAGGVHRPPNSTLQRTGAESIAVERLDSILKGIPAPRLDDRPPAAELCVR
jgi:hypothetical protein